MPELPSVTVYVEHLRRRTVGRTLQRVRIASPFVLRSHDPPINAADGKQVHAVDRLGKRIVFQGRPVAVIRADDVPDEALVCAVGGMGAPTVSNEKLQEGTEIKTAVRALEEHLRREVYAIVIGEIGGGNALGPMITALQCGLPVVDGDSMGRAFPELQMDTFMIYGLGAGAVCRCPTRMATSLSSSASAPRNRRKPSRAA